MVLSPAGGAVVKRRKQIRRWEKFSSAIPHRGGLAGPSPSRPRLIVNSDIGLLFLVRAMHLLLLLFLIFFIPLSFFLGALHRYPSLYWR